jgi:hypothetical protein
LSGSPVRTANEGKAETTKTQRFQKLGSHKVGLASRASRRAKIQIVRHGLFQKCNKESRLRFFGNSEKGNCARFTAPFRVRRATRVWMRPWAEGAAIGFLQKDGHNQLTSFERHVESPAKLYLGAT